MLANRRGLYYIQWYYGAVLVGLAFLYFALLCIYSISSACHVIHSLTIETTIETIFLLNQPSLDNIGDSIPQ